MSNEKKSYKAEVEVRQQLQDQNAQVRDLQMRYSRFGDGVSDLVIHAHRREGSLRKLVHSVTGRFIPEKSRQHRALLNFLERHGVDVFLRQAGAAPDPNKSPSDSQARPRPRRASIPNIASPQRAEDRRRVRLPDGTVVIDRREVAQRRIGRDRREGIEMIYSNNRFGRDRRRPKDRRRSAPLYI